MQPQDSIEKNKIKFVVPSCLFFNYLAPEATPVAVWRGPCGQELWPPVNSHGQFMSYVSEEPSWK